MSIKASEVADWLRQVAGKRDHRELMPEDYVVLRPGPNFDLLLGLLGTSARAKRQFVGWPTDGGIVRC